MSKETEPLSERRAKLIALAAAQRRRFAADLEPWRRPLAIADRGLEAVRFVASHRVLIAGAAAVAAPAAVRATRLGKWLRRGLVAYQVVRQIRARESRA